MRRLLLLPALLLFGMTTGSLLLTGCDSADPEPATGTVTGVLFYPDGATPLGGATVTLADAQMFKPGPGEEVKAITGPQTTTDSQGRYTLEGVPEGEQVLRARRGLFEITFNVTVQAGQTVEAPDQTIEQIGAFGSITGAYDSMHEIGGELEIDIDIIQTSIFDDMNAVSEYDMIFLNCASQISGDTRQANATAFMQNGGTLYASDLSGGTASALIDGLNTGSGGTGSQTIEATVTWPDMANVIGREEVTIRYNLGGWHRIQEMPDNAVSLLEGVRSGQEEAEPLAVIIPVGAGQLVFTTFHNTAGLEEDQREVLRYLIGVGGSSN